MVAARRPLSVPVGTMPSRRAFGLGLAGAVATVLAGCGSRDRAPGAASSGSGAGSVTVEHAFGSTVVEGRPSKVVSAGYTEQDFLLGLGITPIAVTDWYGDQPNAVWPWAQDALGSATPTVLNLDDGFQFVEIAALEPDLIVGVNSGMTKDDYDKLSKIAPTLGPASAEEGWFAPWTEMLAPIGAVLGLDAEATTLRDDVTARFSEAAAANPAFAGTKVAFLQNAVYDGSLIAYQKGLSTDFLTDLGFDVPSEIDEFVREGEQAYIPVERISVLDAADVLVWGTETDQDRAALEAVPGFANLRAVKEGRSVYTGGELAGAIYFASPLSLPYVVDTLVPDLASALG